MGGFGEIWIWALFHLYGTNVIWPCDGFSTHRDQSQAFQLHQGTRSLSSLPSPLCPFFRTIGDESETISPITMDLSRHYLSLYVDDCLLVFSDIQMSLPEILKLFQLFREIAG